MRNISLFAFLLFFTYPSLLTDTCHYVEAIGMDSASHGLLYGDRVVRRYGDGDTLFNRRYPMPRGLQERAEEKDAPNTPNAKVVQNAKDAAAPPKKTKELEPKEQLPKEPKQKNEKPPNEIKQQNEPAVTQGDNDGNDDNEPKAPPNGTPTVAVDGISSNAVAGLAAIGGVFVLVAGLFAFSQRRKNKEMTKSIVSTSAKAWEQQNSTYEKMEEATEPIGSYTVMATYTPTLADELDIQPGDKVTILIEYDDGWVQGINETRGGAKGVFPRHCVDMGTASLKNNKRSSSMGGYTEVDLS